LFSFGRIKKFDMEKQLLSISNKMNNTKFCEIFLFLSILFILINSCTSSNHLPKFGDSKDCATTIEGNFRTPEIYKYPCPAIIFQKEHNIRAMYGDILNINDQGVLLLKRKEGLFDDRDTVFFKYDIIKAIVNEEGFCIWGNLDEKQKTEMKLSLFIKDTDSIESKISSVQLISNEKFSFCIAPGNYEILRIERDLGDIDLISIPESLMRFKAEPNKANYIGDIEIVSINKINDKTIRIPYKKKVRVGNVFFGEMGNMSTTGGTYEIDSVGKFNLIINYDKNFKTISNSEKVISEISLVK
jgi:hypothetical protein